MQIAIASVRKPLDIFSTVYQHCIVWKRAKRKSILPALQKSFKVVRPYLVI